MSPFELCSFCSGHVFGYNFAYFLLLKRVKCPPFLVFTTKTTQPRPQGFSVNDALTSKNAAFLTSFPRQTQSSSKFDHQWLVMGNYACAFSQSESGKYFEWRNFIIAKPSKKKDQEVSSGKKRWHLLPWCTTRWNSVFPPLYSKLSQ